MFNFCLFLTDFSNSKISANIHVNSLNLQYKMSATHQSRRLVLSLYKDLLREGSKFPAYNFRMYALRRTKDAFKENKSVTDGTSLQKCISEAKENLEIIRRQVIIGHLYQADKLIIEK